MITFFNLGNFRFNLVSWSAFVLLITSVGCSIPGVVFSQKEGSNQFIDKVPNQGPIITQTPSPFLYQSSQPTITPSKLEKPTNTLKPTKTPSITPTLINLKARPTTIGYSVSGRPIEIYKFGYGAKGRMIVAGVHGGYEWNTIALAEKLIEHLNQHPEIIPKGMRLFILRSLNPDGEARSQGHAGRTNENGVDINRNFPAYWQSVWDTEGCWDYAPISSGDYPASEPETRALMDFINSHQVDALISYHSAGLGIFPGGRPPDPASISLAETLGSISPYPYPPISVGCEFTGQMADWMSSKGISSVDIELTNHDDIDFDQNLIILKAFLSWEPKKPQDF